MGHVYTIDVEGVNFCRNSAMSERLALLTLFKEPASSTATESQRKLAKA